MKAYQTQNIRNVVLLGSTKSGKTTLSEAMLYEGKVIDRRGTVEAKNTVSDNAEIEQINQRSIYATPLYAEFMDTKFNIIDTPGADDFVGGAVSAFKVCDTGVLVVNAQQGVEVGTQIFSRYAKEYGIPMIVAVNQLDGEKASWENTLETMKEAFGNKPVVVQYPVEVGAGFDGFIDVLKMKLYRFEGDTGKRQDMEIPADRMEEAEELRNALIERAAEYDDTLMETFFDQGSLSEDEIRKGLGIGIREGAVMPIFCLSAKKDIGVKRLMEFTIRTAASPAERKLVTKDEKVIECKQEAPVSLFIYKTAVEQHLGEVAYFKVMSGELSHCLAHLLLVLRILCLHSTTILVVREVDVLVADVSTWCTESHVGLCSAKLHCTSYVTGDKVSNLLLLLAGYCIDCRDSFLVTCFRVLKVHTFCKLA